MERHDWLDGFSDTCLELSAARFHWQDKSIAVLIDKWIYNNGYNELKQVVIKLITDYKKKWTDPGNWQWYCIWHAHWSYLPFESRTGFNTCPENLAWRCPFSSFFPPFFFSGISHHQFFINLVIKETFCHYITPWAMLVSSTFFMWADNDVAASHAVLLWY